MKSFVAALFFCCSTASAVSAASPTVQYFASDAPSAPFSSAVRIGNMVYTSGVIGVGSDGALPADFATQAVNAMNGLSKELKLSGASLDDAYSCNVELADMSNWPAFNAIYIRYFKPGRLPVRMAAGANGLAKGAAVEVACQAFVE